MIPEAVVREHIVPALVRAGEVQEWKARCQYLRHLLLGTYVRRWMESEFFVLVVRDAPYVEDIDREHFDAWYKTLNSFELVFTADEVWADYLRHFVH